MDLFKRLEPVTGADCERVHKSYMVNTNWFISMLWGLLKSFWPEHTRQRLVFVRDYDRQVLTDIEASELPRELGGTADYTLDDAIDTFPSRIIY